MNNVSELIDFLRKGEVLFSISLGTQKQEVFNRFGNLLTVYGDKMVGYLELPGGIRFGYWNDTIDELAVLNQRDDAKYPFQIEGVERELVLGPETTFDEVTTLLDSQDIEWKRLELTNEFEYTILTEGFVGLVFDAETQELKIISQTNHTKEMYKGEFPVS